MLLSQNIKATGIAKMNERKKIRIRSKWLSSIQRCTHKYFFSIFVRANEWNNNNTKMIARHKIWTRTGWFFFAPFLRNNNNCDDDDGGEKNGEQKIIFNYYNCYCDQN